MIATFERIVPGRRLLRAGLLLLVLAALAVPVAALAGAQVPMKGSDAGSWGMGQHDCGALFPVRVDGTGRATHVGAYAYSSRECVDFGTYPFPYTGAFTITAANGNTIVGTYAGTAAFAEDGVTILYDQTATAAGGTGRFAHATGEFDVHGIADDDGTYVQRLSGAISRVGGSHH
jgi:hypothetical protein